MFNGVQEIAIDNKGRIAIPAKFRDALSQYASPFLCTTLKRRSHLLLYPESTWQAVSAQLMNLPTSGKKVLQQFQQLVSKPRPHAFDGSDLVIRLQIDRIYIVFSLNAALGFECLLVYATSNIRKVKKRSFFGTTWL